MNKMRKTRLSIALGAILGVTMAPIVSHGFSVDIGNGEIVTDDTGDALIFPFYTTAEGASTSFQLTNTSGQTVAAKVRFREQTRSMDVLDFIVILSPDDKFDFWVAANGDRPAAYWRDNSCVVGIKNQTTVNGVTTFVAPFPKQTPSGGPRPTVSDADMAVGHVEVIGMLNLANTTFEGADLVDAATHGTDGIPGNCNLLDKAFKSRESVNKIAVKAGEFGSFTGQYLASAVGLPPSTPLVRADVGNVLFGSYTVLNNARGVEAGEDPIVIRNAFNRGFLAAQSPETVQGKTCPVWRMPSGNDLSQLAIGTGESLTVQEVLSIELLDATKSVPDFRDLDDAYLINQGNACLASLYSWDKQEDDHPHLGDINWAGANVFAPGAALATLDSLITANESLEGEWSNNPRADVGFDWVVSFVDKYVYTDSRTTSVCGLSEVATNPGEWMFVNPGDKFVGLLGGLPNDTYGCGIATPFGRTTAKDGVDNVCLVSDTSELVLDIFDTEELSTETISPVGQEPIRLCNETTVLTIENPDAGQEARPSLIQTAQRRVELDILDTGGFDAVRGWANMPLDWADKADVPTHAPDYVANDGAATSGLLWMIRNTADPTINNGSLRELKRNDGSDQPWFIRD